MNKPFELEELLSRIKNLLQSNGRQASQAPARRRREAITQTAFGRVQVNFETHEVAVAGQPARMTPRELQLLKYFVENPERVISRAELLSSVWEMTGNLQTRAVDQFIARLRKIIESDPSDPVHLLTVRDAGYRFVSEPRDQSREDTRSLT